MIENWTLSNFKSIQEEISIQLSPLTIFVGQNSAGKSTLIQSILLTAQTLQSTALDKGCILNGRTIKLGSFLDIRSNNSQQKSIAIGFTLANSRLERETRDISSVRYYYAPEMGSEMSKAACSFSFSNGGGTKSLEMQPQLEAGSITFFATDEDSTSTRLSYRRSGQSLESRLLKLGVSHESARETELSSLDFEFQETSFLTNQRRAFRMPQVLKAGGPILKHFLPSGATAAYDALAFEVDSAYEMLFDPGSSHLYRPHVANLLTEAFRDRDLLKEVYSVYYATSQAMPTEYSKGRVYDRLKILTEKLDYASLRDLLSALPSSVRRTLALQFSEREESIKGILRAGRAPRMEISRFPLPDQISFASEYISSFFTDKLKYLGPLRDEPKSIYPTGSTDPRDVGFKGEYTAAVLDNNKNAVIQYLSSEQVPVTNPASLKLVHAELQDAVKDWLEYLGIARRVESEDKGKLGHELTIATSNSPQLHDLTHVGVGVSQALPIVVLSLLAERGATLIFEQPELHLHPRVQSRLADFFISLTFSGKQCIVETHSEYLISRLRLLSAKARGTSVSRNIGIFFVEKPDGKSTYRKVEVTESGSIKNWPDGFFDEAEQNATELIEVQIQKARRKVEIQKRHDD